MKGGIQFYLAGAVMLLTLAGCANGTSVTVGEESFAAAEDPNDNLSLRERRFGEADFGPDDPGVTVITADKGGNIIWYERKFFGAENENSALGRRWLLQFGLHNGVGNGSRVCHAACSIWFSRWLQ